jgi:hypothetical protein
MERDQPFAFQDDPIYSLQPENTDSWLDERFLDLPAPSHGTSTRPEILQGNCFPDPSHQSSMRHPLHSHFPSGSGAKATL